MLRPLFLYGIPGRGRRRGGRASAMPGICSRTAAVTGGPRWS